MTVEIVSKTPEQNFREKYAWITEEDLTQNGLVVNRATIPIDASGWYRDVLHIGTRDYKGGKIDNELIVEVFNTCNRRGMPSDSQLIILNADKAGTPLKLSLAMAFGIVSCKKSPGINVHYEKSSSLTIAQVNDFLKEALGLKAFYHTVLEQYAQSRGGKK